MGKDTAMRLRMANVTGLILRSKLGSFDLSIIRSPDQRRGSSSRDSRFLLYCKIIMMMLSDTQTVLFITAVLTRFLMGIFIDRNAKDMGLAYWSFLSGGVYMLAFNGMRQMLMLAIAANYCRLTRRGKWGRAIVVILLSSFLRWSALVLLALLVLQPIIRLQHTHTVSVVAALLLTVIVGLTALSIYFIDRMVLNPLSLICVSFDRAAQCAGAKDRWWVLLGKGRSSRSTSPKQLLAFGCMSYAPEHRLSFGKFELAYNRRLFADVVCDA